MEVQGFGGRHKQRSMNDFMSNHKEYDGSVFIFYGEIVNIFLILVRFGFVEFTCGDHKRMFIEVTATWSVDQTYIIFWSTDLPLMIS